MKNLNYHISRTRHIRIPVFALNIDIVTFILYTKNRTISSAGTLRIWPVFVPLWSGRGRAGKKVTAATFFRRPTVNTRNAKNENWRTLENQNATRINFLETLERILDGGKCRYCKKKEATQQNVLPISYVFTKWMCGRQIHCPYEFRIQMQILNVVFSVFIWGLLLYGAVLNLGVWCSCWI